MVPLLPKLRGQFAEFLNHSSPERLSILYLTTCVGLGYGPLDASLEAFLDSMGSPTSPLIRLPVTSHRHAARIYLHHRLHAWPGTTIHRDQLPSCVTPSLDYYQAGSQPHHTRQIRRSSQAQIGWLAHTRFIMVASSRVREYQPVVHRLRLSASP